MERTIAPEAYARALSHALPTFGARLTGGIGDAYWVDDQLYFFCESEVDAHGMIVDRPRIASAVTGQVAAPLSEPQLIDALAAQGDVDAGAPDLSRARYDMPDPATLIVSIGDRVYHVDIADAACQEYEPAETTPALNSPDGRYAAFLRNHAVWLRDRRTGASRQLSPDGEPQHAYGAMQESSVMPLASRRNVPQGLWSTDSRWIVVQRIDERHLDTGGLIEHVPAGGGRARPHLFRVSTPEQELPTIEFVAFHVESGRVVKTCRPISGCSPFGAFAVGECWFAGDHLYYLDWDRFARAVSLVELRLADGATRTVIEEKTAIGWIEVSSANGAQPLMRVLPASVELVWYSERDGHGHLYLHDLATGALKNRITGGDWLVRDVIHVDTARRRIVLLASGFDDDNDDPARRHLCTVAFDGSDFRRLSLGKGDVGARADPALRADQSSAYRPSGAPGSASPGGRHVVVTIGGVDLATRRMLVDLETEGQHEIARSKVDAIWTAPRPQPFVTLAADGVTRLPGALHFPTGFDPARSYPLIVYIYPGPQIGVFDRRLPTKASLFLQSVAELGAIGMILEARGLPHRGRDFHQAGAGLMHEPQLADHVAAIDQLCRRFAFIDRAQVGIFGSSGGGHATARALFDYPEIFKVGVAAAGMHDSRNYLSYWIDRYGSPPDTSGRVEQSNVEVAHRLAGHLLLIHGDMDDNVHPAHTFAIVDALIKADKPFDLLIVPGAGHMAILESAYAYRRMLDYFARHLIGAGPPPAASARWTPPQFAAGLRAVAGVV